MTAASPISNKPMELPLHILIKMAESHIPDNIPRVKEVTELAKSKLNSLIAKSNAPFKMNLDMVAAAVVASRQLAEIVKTVLGNPEEQQEVLAKSEKLESTYISEIRMFFMRDREEIIKITSPIERYMKLTELYCGYSVDYFLIAHHDQANEKLALAEYYFEVLSNNNEPESMYLASISLESTCIMLGKLEKALSYLTISESAVKDIPSDSSNLDIIAHLQIGIQYLNLKKIDEAVKFLDIALEKISNSNNENKIQLLVLLIGVSSLLIEMKNIEKAGAILVAVENIIKDDRSRDKDIFYYELAIAYIRARNLEKVELLCKSISSEKLKNCISSYISQLFK